MTEGIEEKIIICQASLEIDSRGFGSVQVGRVAQGILFPHSMKRKPHHKLTTRIYMLMDILCRECSPEIASMQAPTKLASGIRIWQCVAQEDLLGVFDETSSVSGNLTV